MLLPLEGKIDEKDARPKDAYNQGADKRENEGTFRGDSGEADGKHVRVRPSADRGGFKKFPKIKKLVSVCGFLLSYIPRSGKLLRAVARPIDCWWVA